MPPPAQSCSPARSPALRPQASLFPAFPAFPALPRVGPRKSIAPLLPPLTQLVDGVACCVRRSNSPTRPSSEAVARSELPEAFWEAAAAGGGGGGGGGAPPTVRLSVSRFHLRDCTVRPENHGQSVEEGGVRVGG